MKYLSAVTQALMVPGILSVKIRELTVPSMVELGSENILLDCDFEYNADERVQLDIKWYFSGEEDPILQWVPSVSKKPQTIGQTFKNRLTVSQRSINGSKYKIEQKVRIERPSVHLSGDYTCKVATFFAEQNSSHNLLIFGRKMLNI